jgi:hypothetical protein
MEGGGIRNDDFAGLLAALGRGVSSAPPTGIAPPLSAAMSSALPPSVQPPQYVWQPVPAGSFPNMYPQPQFIAPSMTPQVTAAAEVTVKKGVNPWVVGLLIGAVVICAAIAWMRVMRVKPDEDEDDEEEEDANETFKASARKESREIPTPSAVSTTKVEDYVAENVLQYVNDFAQKDSIDISGMDLPLEYAPPSPEMIRGSAGPAKKRIVAD